MRRKPKQLDAEPTLFQAGGAGTALVPATGARTEQRGQAPPGPAGSGADDDAQVAEVELEADVDPETLRRARQIARQLALRRPPADVSRRGTGELASLRYAGAADDLDLDATLERLAQNPVPEDDDIVVRDRIRSRRYVVLAVDVSGSMRGERVRTAAATVGALVPELSRDEVAVLAFWSDAAILSPLGPGLSAHRVLDTLLRIPARGLTNISFPLELAARQLAQAPARDARVLLLSDCVHNAGRDPRAAAARLPRLDVLLDASGEHDADLARELARLGHGRLVLVRDHRDVAAGLSRIFGDSYPTPVR